MFSFTVLKKEILELRLLFLFSVTLWLKPTGNAPILKNKKWTVEKTQTIATVMGFLKKIMNLESSASMVCINLFCKLSHPEMFVLQ